MLMQLLEAEKPKAFQATITARNIRHLDRGQPHQVTQTRISSTKSILTEVKSYTD